MFLLKNRAPPPSLFATVSLALALAVLLVGCAAPRPAPAPSAEPEEVMGPPIPDTQVNQQNVPQSEMYGPALPAGPEAAPSTSQATAVSTATSVTVTDSTTAAPSATTVSIPVASASPITVGGTSTSTATATATADAPKLCLVLGPGMAKAMAEAAVLEVIRKAHLPVDCVVGTEMGAIVGALYASSNGNTNNLQWQLFKLNKENYFAFPMLSLAEPHSTGRRLNEFLRGLFHDAQIERLPIRFATTAVDDDGDSSVDFEKGDLADALSASTAVPGIFDSWKIGEHSFRSAASAEPAPLDLARRLGGNFLVLVDVLIDGGAPAKSRYHRAFTGARSVMKLEKKEAQFVIQVNTGAIAFDDFTRRADLLSAGTAAAERAMPELKAAWEKWSTGQR